MSKGHIISKVAVMVASLVLAPQAFALSFNEIIQKVNEGELYGGAVSFEVPPAYQTDFQNSFTVIGTGNGPRIIVRDQDLRNQQCLDAINAGWFTKISKGMTSAEIALHAANASNTNMKGVRDCNRQWHQRIADTISSHNSRIENLKIRARDNETRKQVAEILKGVKDISLNLGDQKESLDSIERAMGDLATYNRNISESLQAQMNEADRKQKLQDLKDSIDTGAQFAQLLAGVVFKKNPASAYKVGVAVNGITTIAKNIIDLGGGLETGAKIAASMNVANAAISMVSMLGGSGADPTAAMIQSGFSSIRADIHDLSIQMNDRFDRVEEGMAIIYSNMNKRFDRLNYQVERVIKLIEVMNRRELIQWTTVPEALAALLSQKFFTSYSLCSSPGGEAFLSIRDLRECQINYTIYSRQGAKQKVLTGDSLFNPDLNPEESMLKLASIEEQYHLGYLQASLRNGIGNPGASSAMLSLRTASPYTWASVVDAYIATFSLAERLREPISEKEFVKLTWQELPTLRDEAIDILNAEKAVRTDGVAIAVKIYLKRLEELAAALSADAANAAGTEELAITGEDDYRYVLAGYSDNNHLRITLRRGSALFVKEGQEKGKNLITTRYRSRTLPDVDISGNGQANTEAWIHLAQTQLVYDDDPLRFGLNTYESEVVTSESEIASAKLGAHSSYIASAKISEMNDSAKKAMFSFPTKFKLPESNLTTANACNMLSLSRVYLFQLALLDRTISGEKPRWYEALGEIPGGGAIGAKEECSEIIDFWARSALPSSLEQAKLTRDYFQAWITNAVDVKVKAFVEAYNSADQDVTVPLIQSRLVEIDRLISQIPSTDSLLPPVGFQALQ